MGFLNIKRNTVSIEIGLEDQAVYLAGEAAEKENNLEHFNVDDLVERGSLLRGSLRLNANATCRFRSLRVVLTGILRTPALDKGDGRRCTLPAQTCETVRHEINLLDGASPNFDIGRFTIPFAILLPAGLQPSFRCLYGKLEYTVQAFADDVHYGLIKSRPRSFEVIARGEIEELGCEQTSLVIHHAQFGSISASLTCETPCIGAQAQFQLQVPLPKDGRHIDYISMSLVQNVRVHSPKLSVDIVRESVTSLYQRATPRPETYQVGPASNMSSSIRPISIDSSVRLPTHETLTPSSASPRASMSSADLSVTVTHHMLIKIGFTTVEGVAKELAVKSKNITLLSCKCLPDSMVAPPYSPRCVADTPPRYSRSGNFASTAPASKSWRGACTCFSSVPYAGA